jgi:hypothetical protein
MSFPHWSNLKEICSYDHLCLFALTACGGITGNHPVQETSITATVVFIQQTAAITTAVEVAIKKSQTARANIPTPKLTTSTTPATHAYLPVECQQRVDLIVASFVLL